MCQNLSLKFHQEKRKEKDVIWVLSYTFQKKKKNACARFINLYYYMSARNCLWEFIAQNLTGGKMGTPIIHLAHDFFFFIPLSIHIMLNIIYNQNVSNACAQLCMRNTLNSYKTSYNGVFFSVVHSYSIKIKFILYSWYYYRYLFTVYQQTYNF